MDETALKKYLAEDFVAHNPPFPGVSLDREGMKQAAEIFRVATPGRHEIPMQALPAIAGCDTSAP